MSERTASLEEAAAVLRGGGVVAFTGAGMSAESGIPTFRDPGGLWERFDPEDFGTWEGIARVAMTRPDRLADFLLELRRVFAAARPGPPHEALVRLEAARLLDGIVTQNVDGLHQEAGSTTVVEIHGSFARTLCLVCGSRNSITRAEFLHDLERSVTGLRTAFVPSFASLLPRCEVCGGPCRPDFVAFGETVQDFDLAEAMAGQARVLLVVGTSGEVYPAARLPEDVRRGGGMVIEVSPGRTLIEADHRLLGEAGRILPRLAEQAVVGMR